MKRTGMMVVLLALLAHLTTALECYAGDSKIIFLIGKVEPSPELTVSTNPRPGQMSVTLRYEDDLSVCYSPERGAPLGALWFFEMYGFEKVARQSARLEIMSPGYKKFSKNIPSIKFTKNVARLDIGVIQLQKSDLPTVEQVIHSRSADGSHRFEITLHNRLQRDFLIRELTLAARIPGPMEGWSCCCPPNAIFDIRDVLKIGAGDKRVASADFEELVRGKELTVKAEGSVEIHGCEGSETLVLTMPTAVMLPAAQYIAVQVVLPQRFRVVHAFYGFGRHEISSGSEPSLSRIDNGDVDHFRSYKFTFRTSMEDELDIVGAYERRESK